jgi:hypothetical protein
MIACIGVLVMAGCYSDPSAGINNSNYNLVQATPNFMVLRVGDSTQVIARLVNSADNGAITSYTVGSVGAGILVHYQVNYRPIYDATRDTLVPTTDKDAQQYYVVGAAVGKYSFTLTPTSVNTGISSTVTVTVTPLNLAAALNKTTANPGDTVTVTAPTGTVFSQTSAITFATGTIAIVSRSADSTQIAFVVSGGVTGPATVTKVGVIASPTIAGVTLVTTNSLTTPAPVGPTLSVTTAAAGATVTLTAAPNGFFSTTSVVTFTTGSISTPVRSADSTVLTFLVGPGITGPATVTNMGLKSAPTLPLITETSTNSLVTTALTVAPTTVSNATPNIAVTITVALSGGLRYLANSHVFIGGVEAGIQSVSADSSTATVMPALSATGGPGSGLITYTNIALSFLNTVPLSVPGNASVTVAATYGGGLDPNAGSITTASTLTLPPSGRSFVFYDSGPYVTSTACPTTIADGCRLYKIVLTGTGTFDVDLRWQGCADMGLYTLNSGGTGNKGVADNGGQCTSAGQQPETGTTVAMPAGTYFIAIEYFDVLSGYGTHQASPAYIGFRITAH